MNQNLIEKQNGRSPETYHLRLFIAGLTTRSSRALTNVKQVCEDHLQGRYELRVIDLYQQPHLAREAQIVAVPTLIRDAPPPVRRIIGDLSDKQRLLAGLDL